MPNLKTAKRLAFVFLIGTLGLATRTQTVKAGALDTCVDGDWEWGGCTAWLDVSSCESCGDALYDCVDFCNEWAWNWAGLDCGYVGDYCDDLEGGGTSPDPVTCQCGCAYECID